MSQYVDAWTRETRAALVAGGATGVEPIAAQMARYEREAAGWRAARRECAEIEMARAWWGVAWCWSLGGFRWPEYVAGIRQGVVS